MHSPTACSVHVPDSKDHLPNVRQDQLETVVPRAEYARVLVLRGPHRCAQLLMCLLTGLLIFLLAACW